MTDSEKDDYAVLAARLCALQKLMDERDKRYEERADSQKDAIEAALIAQKETTSNALVAAKESAAKTEAAQTAYNIGHNDLLKKLEAGIQRPEFDAAKAGWQDKFDSAKDSLKAEISTLKDSLKAEIATLRESRSQMQGRSSGFATSWAITVSLAIIAISLVGLLVKFIGK